MKFSYIGLAALVANLASNVLAADPPTLVPATVNGNSFTPFTQVDFCKKSGQTSSDGTQIKAGACSSTPQGSIPSFDKMVSTLIIQPDSGANFDASKDNTVTIALQNLQTGFFDDPQKQYYLFPQTLNKQGIIEGHDHITIQQLNGKSVPDARVFAFFKGLNAASTDGSTLSVTVPAGTIRANGQFRICSMSGTFSHQPVIMPVAQRGAQDDCIRVNVINAGKVPPPATVAAATTTAAAAATTAAAAATGVSSAGLGSCSASAAKLVVGLGVDPANAKEVRFVPGGFKKDPIFGGQGSALNGGIVANFICDRLNDQCKAPASTVTACRAAKLKVDGQKGGANLSAQQVSALVAVADAFNKAIGISGSSAAAAAVTTTAAAAAAGTTAAAANSGGNCNAQTVQVVVNGNEQRFGLDGAQVALNPKVVLDRVCIAISRTNNAQCTKTCNDAETAALALGVVGNSQGKGDLTAMQKLADQFNSALAGKTVKGTVIVIGSTGAAAAKTTTTTVAAAAKTNAASASGLGSCSASAAKLVVGLGVDPANAKEVRFVPGGFKKDPIFGGQGSALNGGIIANFICDRLNDQCKAPASTVTACRAAKLKVDGQKGGSNLSTQQVAALEAVANAFNSAIGITGNKRRDVRYGRRVLRV